MKIYRILRSLIICLCIVSVTHINSAYRAPSSRTMTSAEQSAYQARKNKETERRMAQSGFNPSLEAALANPQNWAHQFITIYEQPDLERGRYTSDEIVTLRNLISSFLNNVKEEAGDKAPRLKNVIANKETLVKKFSTLNVSPQAKSNVRNAINNFWMSTVQPYVRKYTATKESERPAKTPGRRTKRLRRTKMRVPAAATTPPLSQVEKTAAPTPLSAEEFEEEEEEASSLTPFLSEFESTAQEISEQPLLEEATPTETPSLSAEQIAEESAKQTKEAEEKAAEEARIQAELQKLNELFAAEAKRQAEAQAAAAAGKPAAPAAPARYVITLEPSEIELYRVLMSLRMYLQGTKTFSSLFAPAGNLQTQMDIGNIKNMADAKLRLYELLETSKDLQGQFFLQDSKKKNQLLINKIKAFFGDKIGGKVTEEEARKELTESRKKHLAAQEAEFLEKWQSKTPAEGASASQVSTMASEPTGLEKSDAELYAKLLTIQKIDTTKLTSHQKEVLSKVEALGNAMESKASDRRNKIMTAKIRLHVASLGPDAPGTIGEFNKATDIIQNMRLVYELTQDFEKELTTVQAVTTQEALERLAKARRGEGLEGIF